MMTQTPRRKIFRCAHPAIRCHAMRGLLRDKSQAQCGRARNEEYSRGEHFIAGNACPQLCTQHARMFFAGQTVINFVDGGAFRRTL